MTRDNPDQPAKTSIRFKGVQRHLSLLEKSGDLNGFKAYDVIRMLDTPESKRPDATNLGRMFGKSRHTINKWLSARKEEREAEAP
jgi:hypothetical protein